MELWRNSKLTSNIYSINRLLLNTWYLSECLSCIINHDKDSAKKFPKSNINFGTLPKPEAFLEMVMGQVIALSGIAYSYLVTICWVLKICQTLKSFLLLPPVILRTPLWGRYYYFQFSGKSLRITKLTGGLGLKPGLNLRNVVLYTTLHS